jgi:hypothetical protein
MRPGLAFAALVGSALMGGVWLVAGKLHAGAYPLGIEPIYPGLAMSLAVFLLDRALRKGAFTR